MLVLAPVMCILGGIAVSSSLGTYMKYLDTEKAGAAVTNGVKSGGGRQGGKVKEAMGGPLKKEGVAMAFVGMMTFFLITYTFHCTWVTSEVCCLLLFQLLLLQLLLLLTTVFIIPPTSPTSGVQQPQHCPICP